MRHGADKLPRRIARQLRIGIERDDVLHLRENGRRADNERKTVGMTAAQERVQIAKLAALAFVAHPNTRLGVPAPGPVE